MQTGCDFVFSFCDVTAGDEAQFAVSENQPFADAADINTEEGLNCPAVATLEHNFGWVLDGSKEALPDDAAAYDWGWWSKSQSGADGSFAEPPVLEIAFYNAAGEATPHSSPGITLLFSGSLARDIRIEWLDATGTVLAEGDFPCEDFNCYCDKVVENYYGLRISIGGMKAPGRFLRVIGLAFGEIMPLYGEKIISARSVAEIGVGGESLPAGELELELLDRERRFALLNPEGTARLLQLGQRIEAYKSIDGDRRQIGRFYLVEGESRDTAVLRLRAQDVLGVLDRVEQYGGMYQSKDCAELLSELLGPVEVAFSVDEALSGETVTGWLPICSVREALRQVAFAVGAYVLVRADGSLYFAAGAAATRRSIGTDRRVIGHKLSLEESVTQVDVTAYAYKPGVGQSWSDPGSELLSALLSAGEHRLTFSAPSSVSKIEGAELLESHVNYCIVSVPEEATVTVIGLPYSEMTTVESASLEKAAGSVTNVKSISGMTLLDSAAARKAAERLLAVYQQQLLDEGELLPGWDGPGEAVTVITSEGSMSGLIEYAAVELSGGGILRTKIRGGVK